MKLHFCFLCETFETSVLRFPEFSLNVQRTNNIDDNDDDDFDNDNNN